MTEEYQKVLHAARRKDEEVLAACRVGSRVYGTDTPESDHDYSLVLKVPPRFNDLVRQANLNITVRGSATYYEAIRMGNVFSLECMFAPRPHVLKVDEMCEHYRVEERHRRDVALEALSRSASDFNKGVKISDPKRVYHAFRVLAFAEQVADTGRIHDFSVAQQIYEEVMTEPRPLGEAFQQMFEARYGSLHARY